MHNTDTAIASGLGGRVAFITGAGQGLGSAFAHAFAAAGAIPVIVEIDGAKAERVGGEIAQLQRRALPVACDVSDEARSRPRVERTRREFGRIDIIVNNVAIFSTLTMRPSLTGTLSS